MKQRPVKVTVTKKFLAIETIVDYGGPIRFQAVKVPWDMLREAGVDMEIEKLIRQERQRKLEEDELDSPGLF